MRCSKRGGAGRGSTTTWRRGLLIRRFHGVIESIKHFARIIRKYASCTEATLDVLSCENLSTSGRVSSLEVALVNMVKSKPHLSLDQSSIRAL